MKYLHSLTNSQSRSMQWNSLLVHNGMPQGTINSSCSSISNWVSCLNNWLLLANAINYSRLSQLIALHNLTNPTVVSIFLHHMKTEFKKVMQQWTMKKSKGNPSLWNLYLIFMIAMMYTWTQCHLRLTFLLYTELYAWKCRAVSLYFPSIKRNKNSWLRVSCYQFSGELVFIASDIS